MRRIRSLDPADAYSYSNFLLGFSFFAFHSQLLGINWLIVPHINPAVSDCYLCIDLHPSSVLKF